MKIKQNQSIEKKSKGGRQPLEDQFRKQRVQIFIENGIVEELGLKETQHIAYNAVKDAHNKLTEKKE